MLTYKIFEGIILHYKDAIANGATHQEAIMSLVNEEMDTQQTKNEDILSIANDIAIRSDGNPGALQVMCQGVVFFGIDFFRRIERANLTGSSIWCLFKDKHEYSYEKMYEELK